MSGRSPTGRRSPRSAPRRPRPHRGGDPPRHRAAAGRARDLGRRPADAGQRADRLARARSSEHREQLIKGAAVAGFVVGGIVALRRRGATADASTPTPPAPRRARCGPRRSRQAPIAKVVLVAALVVAGLYFVYLIRDVIGLIADRGLLRARDRAAGRPARSARGARAGSRSSLVYLGDRRRDLRHRPADRAAAGRGDRRPLRGHPRLHRRPARERDLPRVRRPLRHHLEPRGAGDRAAEPSSATPPGPCATSPSASSRASSSCSRSS